MYQESSSCEHEGQSQGFDYFFLDMREFATWEITGGTEIFYLQRGGFWGVDYL